MNVWLSGSSSFFLISKLSGTSDSTLISVRIIFCPALRAEVDMYDFLLEINFLVLRRFAPKTLGGESSVSPGGETSILRNVSQLRV